MKIRANECLLDLYFHHIVCPRWLVAAHSVFTFRESPLRHDDVIVMLTFPPLASARILMIAFMKKEDAPFDSVSNPTLCFA